MWTGGLFCALFPELMSGRIMLAMSAYCSSPGLHWYRRTLAGCELLSGGACSVGVATLVATGRSQP